MAQLSIGYLPEAKPVEEISDYYIWSPNARAYVTCYESILLILKAAPETNCAAERTEWEGANAITKNSIINLFRYVKLHAVIS